MNTKGSDTLVGRLRKVGMYPAIIFFFFIFLFFYFFIYFFFFLLECRWSAKMLSIEG